MSDSSIQLVGLLHLQQQQLCPGVSGGTTGQSIASTWGLVLDVMRGVSTKQQVFFCQAAWACA
jgi:hypothetical protein